ncbi:MAG: hypothetical protein AB1792_10840 [Candidatus Zixiibacteriota bacterium]
MRTSILQRIVRRAVPLVATLATAYLLLPVVARGQTTLNPDISLIGDVRSFWHNDTTRSDRKALNLGLHEAELAVQGYLNPYARADAFFAWHEGAGAEVEELYVTFVRGLPLGLSVKAGQHLLDFGRVNPLHPHAYSFIERSLAHLEFFGEEGLRDVGVQASLPLPTGDVATTIAAELLKGGFLTPHTHSDVETGDGEAEAHVGGIAHEAEEETVPNKRGFAGRWDSFFALGDYTSLNLGASAVTGIPAEGQRRWLIGSDLKLRWKPDRYRSFTAVVEWIINRAPVHVHDEEESAARHAQALHEENAAHLTRHGTFAYADYQFRQRYNIGAVGDWTQTLHDAEGELWRLGAFGGFAPVEETSLLRLLVAYQRDVESATGYWSAMMQLIFSLGPHRPHAF